MSPTYVRHTFDAFPVLSSDEMTLRRITPEDAAGIQEITFYDGVAAASEHEGVQILERIEQDYAQGNSIHWGICLEGTDEVIGTCGFYRGYPDNIGEIGYVLKEAYRRKGIMTVAARLVIAFGLEEMGLDGIVAYTQPTNQASITVLERLSFTRVVLDQDTLKFVL